MNSYSKLNFGGTTIKDEKEICEPYVVHAVFWCSWCKKFIPREEVEIGDHASTPALIFSHSNHLLEIREYKKENLNNV